MFISLMVRPFWGECFGRAAVVSGGSHKIVRSCQSRPEKKFRTDTIRAHAINLCVLGFRRTQDRLRTYSSGRALHMIVPILGWPERSS